jgi:tetratricopeptide (TPR) repeat protein
MIGWMLLSLGVAQADPGGAGATAEEDTEGERVGGKQPPPLAREPRPAELTFELPKATLANVDELPYPHLTYLGAEAMKLDPMFVYGVQQGLELMFLRKYNESRDHFSNLEQTFPGTGVRAVADTLVWQGLMLENFDYRYDKQYWTSSKTARSELETAISTPGNNAWEHLAMASVVGIESIHTMRKGSYLSALQLAFSAMDHIEKCRAAAPNLLDLKLADGMYNYWRSVITMNSKVLPDFGDHRPEGLEQMSQVQSSGIFIAPLASLALAFSWAEEGNYKNAISACVRNRTKYPDNIINNLTCGMIYTYDRKFPEAMTVYERVLQVDPNNSRVHYWKGYTLLKSGQFEAAKGEFTTYLGSQHLEPYHQSFAYFRLGQAYARLQDYTKAAENYRAAIKVDGNKGAKKALEGLEQRKKDGKIDL